MQQILNSISAELKASGVLEKVACKGKKELPFGEAAINWSVQGLRAGAYIKSHTSGSVASSSRTASFEVSLKAPDYKSHRPLRPDEIYARVQASAGMAEGEAIKTILARDIKELTADMRLTVEKQVGLLLTSGDVEYTDDTDTVKNFPCYTGSSPITHTQTIKMQSTSSGTVTHTGLECLNEMVQACQAKGFNPDAVILGSTAVNQLLADKALMELFDRNMNLPGVIELGAEDGGAYVGRINVPAGAALDVYSCNESDNGAFIGAKQGVCLVSGCCTCAFGSNSFADDNGNFETRNERLSLTKRREGIDQNLYIASRAVVLPDSMSWIVATVAE